MRSGKTLLNDAIKKAIETLESEPCENCVSREFMYKLGAKCIAARNENGELIAITSIESLPPVTPKQRWTPVSEGLPEQETNVLICNRQGEIEIAQGSRFDNGTWEWYTSGWRYGEVIAWMPLPEPYKEGECEERCN